MMRTVFIGIGIYIVIFVAILVLAISALRRSRQPIIGIFWRAWIAAVLSVLGFFTDMRVSYLVNGKGIDWNIKWLYLIPVFISAWALINHFKARRAPEPASRPPAT
jgi:hypothetical protein